MPQRQQPPSRRRLIRTAMGAAALVGLASARALAATPTPSQTEGPFYPLDKPADRNNDLIHVDGQTAPAQGERLTLGGRVLDSSGAPVPDARVEIWQCDHHGVYHHPYARRSDADPGFQGFGETLTDADGRYDFLTLVPVPYPGRPPHIHAKLHIGGRERLTTQLYLRDHPENDRDGLFGFHLGGDRDRLMIRTERAGEIDGVAAYSAEFDFVV